MSGRAHMPPETGPRAPESESALAALLQRDSAAGAAFVPVTGASQTRFLPPPQQRISLHALPQHIDVDAHAAQARIRGPVTWAALEAEAILHGLSAAHIARPAEGCSVLGTLAAPALLPETWLSPAAGAACLSVETLDRHGVRSSTVDAPRTASGPDLRRLHIGREGRHGVLLSATLGLVRAGTSTVLASDEVASAEAIRRALCQFPHRAVLLPGSPTMRFLLLVRDVETREGAWVVRTLRDAGLETLPAGTPRRPESASSAVLVSAPWPLLAPLWSQSRNTLWLEAATATHAQVALAPDARGTPGRIAALADRSGALAPLVRVSWRGALEPAARPLWPFADPGLLPVDTGDADD